MAKDIFRKAKRFPKGHLALAGSLMSITALVLTIVPSSEVEATRSEVQLLSPGDTSSVGTLLPQSDSASRLQIPVTVRTADTQPIQPTVTEVEPIPASDTEQATLEAEDRPVELVAEAEAAVPEPSWIEYKVQSGDNLTKLFRRAGLGPRDVYEVSQADVDTRHFSKLRPGQTVALIIEEGSLQRLKIVQNRLDSIEFVRQNEGFNLAVISIEPEVRTKFVAGTINSSLYLGAQQAGLSDRTTMELAQIFAWDVDFALDIRQGDEFRVLFEEKYLEGEKIGEGNILAAEFTNNGDTFAAVRYEDSKGDVNYFTPDGRSMRKAFLRSPVDFRRISSNFNPERYHPVLGVKRPHRGTDYAAATGTPIRASGDGKVIWRGTKGGYGKTVILQHGGEITTLYGHMSRYQSGVTSGSRVQQGDIIGYVGMTGTATGPHLHYEFRVSGVHKNPMTVKLPDAEPIASSELARFKAETSLLIAELQKQAVQQVASID